MTYNPQYLIMTVFSAVKKPFEIADITDISYIYLQAMNITYVIIQSTGKFGLAIFE